MHPITAMDLARAHNAELLDNARRDAFAARLRRTRKQAAKAARASAKQTPNTDMPPGNPVERPRVRIPLTEEELLRREEELLRRERDVLRREHALAASPSPPAGQ